MASINKLPREVLEILFSRDYLTTREGAECVRIQKNWKDVAEHCLYSDITITDNRSALKLIGTINTVERFRPIIKVIRMQRPFINDRNAAIGLIHALARHCINLQKITAHEISDEFCDQLHAYVSHGQLTTLAQFPKTDDYDKYKDAALTLSMQLKCLYIYDTLIVLG